MRSKVGVAFAATLFCALVIVAPSHAVFPGANGKIAFVSNFGPASDVSVINPDGTGETDLTNTPAIREEDPAWSPDGTKIVFTSNRDPSDPNCDDLYIPCNTEIYVMNADGTGQTRLTYTTNEAESSPTWTPDGTKITFTRLFGCNASGCNAGLYTINVDGTGETHQPSPGAAGSSAWSPGGNKLAYGRYSYDTNAGDLATINPDGSGLAHFCCDSSAAPDDPSWSPDGTAMTFDYQRQVARQNLDGGGFAFLATSPFPKEDLYPAWSPNGTKIAFFSDRDDTFGVYVMNANGSGQTKLTNGIRPDWQPIPTPRRSDYKNAAQFCKAERDFLGDEAFTKKYGTNGNRATAYGKCVSGK